MKKLLIIAFAAISLAACGTAYNKQLQQVELGMTDQQIVNLMGNKYTTVGNNTIKYVDRYKNHWFFVFNGDGRLVKWYKETE